VRSPRGLSQFGREFAAVEAERPDPHPSPPDADVAGLDVALADPAPFSGLPTPWAEVMRLEPNGLQ